MAKKKATKKVAKKVTKKTAAKKATKKVAKKSTEMLLVASKTKDALKGKGFNVSSDTLAALNERVYELVAAAQMRCSANGRKTIRPYDV